jgi:DNA-binding transcriptional regulator YiaG
VKKHLKVKKVDARKLPQGLGLNQAEFSERLEITQSSCSRYESGRAMP